MALVVEDGTGKTDAEAYASVADADAYIAKWELTATGWPSTTYTEAKKEVALRTGARYLDLLYRLRFRSRKANETQALEHPRDTFEDHDGYWIMSSEIHPCIVEANIEFAMVLASGAKILPDTVGEQVLFERNETEASMKTVRYSTPKMVDALGDPVKSFPLIERILSPVLQKARRLDRS